MVALLLGMGGTILLAVGVGTAAGIMAGLFAYLWSYESYCIEGDNNIIKCIAMWGAGSMAATAALTFAVIWSNTPEVPEEIGSAAEAGAVLGSLSCDVDVPDLSDPDDVRDSLRYLSEDRDECAFEFVEKPVEFGCNDFSAPISDTAEYPEYVVKFPWHIEPLSSPAELIESANESAFVTCLLLAASDVYMEDAPDMMSVNVLYETWVEMCGGGERSSLTEGFLSKGASASGTDYLLVDALVSDGMQSGEAIEAVLLSYVSNNIDCPAVRFVDVP